MIIIIYYNASYTTNFSNFSEIGHLSLFLMYNVHTIFCLTFLQRIMLVVLCSFSIIDVIYCTLFVRMNESIPYTYAYLLCRFSRPIVMFKYKDVRLLNSSINFCLRLYSYFFIMQ